MSMGVSSTCVCVTGGSGFIGSWLVRFLLDRGYTVHATVKNLDDEAETKHLQALDGAASRLRLFQMDLLDPASILAAIKGTAGVFHLAAVFTLDRVQDPEKEFLDPAVKGTLNVLRAAKDSGVGRVMVTSSSTAVAPNPNWPIDLVIDEDSWADVNLLRKLELWYNLSKTLAEKAAWEFAVAEGLDMVVINPGLVLGPSIQPNIGAAIKLLLYVLQGNPVDLQQFYIGCVDVRDVAKTMILLYENQSAQGRHLCEESVARWADFINKVIDLCPEYKVQRVLEDNQTWVVRSENPPKKMVDLGISFTPVEKTIRDTVADLKSKGYI